MDAFRHHLPVFRPAALLVLAVTLWAACAGTAGATNLPAGFEEETIATGLDQPSMVAWAPDGRMFVAERPGRVRVVDAAGSSRPRPLIDITDHVNGYWDHGLLGMAVDASFASNHYLYLLYTYERQLRSTTDGPKSSRLTRITVKDNNTGLGARRCCSGRHARSPVPPRPTRSTASPPTAPAHSIGTVRSAPDGTLWVGSGDAADFGGVDTAGLPHLRRAQLRRQDPAHRPQWPRLPSHPFCPADTDLTHVCTKVYAKGFRNPFRFTLRPGGGLVVGDVGWNSCEEVDLLRPRAARTTAGRATRPPPARRGTTPTLAARGPEGSTRRRGPRMPTSIPSTTTRTAARARPSSAVRRTPEAAIRPSTRAASSSATTCWGPSTASSPTGRADGRSAPSRARGPASLSRPLPATATSCMPTCSGARSAASSSRARPERSTTRPAARRRLRLRRTLRWGRRRRWTAIRRRGGARTSRMASGGRSIWVPPRRSIRSSSTGRWRTRRSTGLRRRRTGRTSRRWPTRRSPRRACTRRASRRGRRATCG